MCICRGAHWASAAFAAAPTLSGGSATATIEVTAEDEVTKNTYVVQFSGIEPITALDINTPENLEQTGGPEQVSFTVTPTPAQNVDLSSIDWYVNGEKQAVTGAVSDFTPPDVGTYEICAKVGTAVVSQTRTVSVSQVAVPDEVILYDDFEGYGNEGTVVPFGSQNKWTNGSSSLVIGTDASQGKTGKFISAGATQYISIQKKADMNYEPIIISGKMRIDGDYNLGYSYSVQFRN